MAIVVPLDRRVQRGPARSPASVAVPEQTDGDLVCAALGGDRTAKELLLRRHLKDLRRLAYRLLPSDSELEDLVQETCMLALRELPSLADPERFGAWFKGVLANVVRKRLRKRKRSRLLGLWATRDDIDTSFISPAAPPDVAAELRAIYRAIERLEPDCRMALVLHRIQKQTLSEVAEVLGISYPTAKRLVARAQHELEVELGRRRES